MHRDANASRQPPPPALTGKELPDAGPPRRPARPADRSLPRRSPLTAPERLVADTRAAFRQAALAFIDQSARDDWPSVDIDLGPTLEIDASGLGILVLVERRARAHGLSTRLLRAREPVRRLLALTKLDDLFDFVG